MQVHHEEGLANRIDPESCAGAREGIDARRPRRGLRPGITEAHCTGNREISGSAVGLVGSEGR
jgi:hypothetical protein